MEKDLEPVNYNTMQCWEYGRESLCHCRYGASNPAWGVRGWRGSGLLQNVALDPVCPLFSYQCFHCWPCRNVLLVTPLLQAHPQNKEFNRIWKSSKEEKAGNEERVKKSGKENKGQRRRKTRNADLNEKHVYLVLLLILRSHFKGFDSKEN